MSVSVTMKRLLAGAFCAGLVACGSAEPVAFSGLASSSQLVPNKQDDSSRIPFRYSTPIDWRSYSRIIIEPVTTYSAADHQFGDLPDSDKVELANYMQSRFTETLSSRFTRATDAAPNTLRLKLTLTGATTNTPVLSTFTHLDLAGNLYNGMQAVRGREGMIAGSVTYAVEICDAPTNRLLSAFVTKQYPGALNVVASFGSLAAAKTGIDKGANALLESFK